MNRLFKKEEIFTIPNLLSFFRLLLIPVIIWFYCVKENHNAATGIIILSGITDIADGIIARKFNMVSDFGKIIDPIADKLTQVTLIVCLSIRYKLMIMLIILFVLKECILATLGILTIKNNCSVNSAKWHGKLNTVALYSTMVLLILFPGIPAGAVNFMIILCVITMLTSLLLYAKFYMTLLNESMNRVKT